jgi:hypothetical protein
MWCSQSEKKTSRRRDATTDRLSEAITRPGGYPSRIQGTSHCRLCIYFIDVLFAITRSYRTAKRHDGRQTWPPGPELREKAMSTAALGIGHPLKRISQSRAAAASFEVSRFERGGGVGSDSLLSVLCRAVRRSGWTRGLEVAART